jgi:hypothetical protein
MSALADYYAAQSGQIRDQSNLGRQQLREQSNQNQAQNALASRAQDLQAAQIANQSREIGSAADARQQAIDLARNQAQTQDRLGGVAATSASTLSNAQAANLSNPAQTDFLRAQTGQVNGQTSLTNLLTTPRFPAPATPNAPATGNSFWNSLSQLRNGTYGLPGYAFGSADIGIGGPFGKIGSTSPAMNTLSQSPMSSAGIPEEDRAWSQNAPPATKALLQSPMYRAEIPEGDLAMLRNPSSALASGTDKIEGTHASDVVPAMLAPGEAVLNKAAAEHLGRGVIAHLNNMGMLKMAADRAAAGGSTSQVQTTSDGQDMHQAMTQKTQSFAGGSDDVAVARAQQANGTPGGYIGPLSGGILDGVNPFTGNKIFAGGNSGPIGPYTGPSAATLEAQRAAAQPPQPTYFAVPVAPAGFQGMQAPQHFAKGKAKVSKGGGGKAPMPEQAQPQQAQAPQPQSPMQGGTDQMPMPMPMQNYAMGTEEVRPNAELMPGGMPMGSGYAKGTAKVPPAKAAAKQKAAAKMAGKPASKPMPMPAQSPQLPVPQAQQASSMPQASIPAMPTMPVM